MKERSTSAPWSCCSWLLALGLLAAAPSACGGSNAGADDAGSNEPPACTPDCTGKQCGPNGCGGSCGSCDDKNDCTADSCSASGQCEHVPVADGHTCSNLTLHQCTNGVPSTVDCRATCKSQGKNVTATCYSLQGCSLDECCCASLASTCSQSSSQCNSSSMQITCDPARGEWIAETCSTFCQRFGYASSDGCRPAPFGFCTCLGVTSGTRYCHAAQGDCSDKTIGCCPGLVCTWQYLGGAGRYSCLPPTTCEARCQVGSVCCGGGFCAGDCTGNPCCS